MVNRSPRSIRNFWIEMKIDGKKTPITTGPKNGGIEIVVYMRNKKTVEKVLEIKGNEVRDKLYLSIKNIDEKQNLNSSRMDFTIETER